MAAIKSFRELDVWSLAMELVVDCYNLTALFPRDERFGLTSQCRRAAVSIPSNVAEGHNRHARNAYLNHVNIALGSQGELDTQLEVAERLGYLTATELTAARDKLSRVGQMLHGLQRSLENSPTRYTGLLTLLTWLGLAAWLS